MGRNVIIKNNFKMGSGDHYLTDNGMLLFARVSKNYATRWQISKVFNDTKQLIITISKEKDKNIEVSGKNCFINNGKGGTK